MFEHRQRAADGRRRYVWVDMFCASQNLLAGVYRDPAVTKQADPAGYAARKEDTDRIFDDALDAVDEILEVGKIWVARCEA